MAKDRDHHQDNASKPKRCKIVVGQLKGKPVYCGTPLVDGKCPQTRH